MFSIHQNTAISVIYIREQQEDFLVFLGEKDKLRILLLLSVISTILPQFSCYTLGTLERRAAVPWPNSEVITCLTYKTVCAETCIDPVS